MTLSPKILLIITACIAALLVVIIAYIGYKRFKQQRVFAARDAYIKRYETTWYRYLVLHEPFDDAAIPKTKGAFLAVEQLLLSYVDNVSDARIEAKISDFAKRYLYNYYRHMLAQHKWSRRMNALYRIDDFQMDTLLAPCIALYDKKSTTREERYTLMAIFANYAPQTFAHYLYTKRSDFSEFEYRRIYVTLSKAQLLDLVQNIERLPTASAQYALIDTLGAMKDLQYVEQLTLLLQEDDAELRIRVLKSLYELSWIEDVSLYEPFVQSAIWEERLMVAKILKYVPLLYSENMLLTLLEDANWWVRQQAAETMMRYEEGADVLKCNMVTTTDRFAKDMAQQVLTKAGVPT
ncbi:MAG: HEAT repeat domain-containing protein [Caryophanon sp.]|nr:HEAT repeat domain-containing protein [Caryophanon sp.]